MPDDTVQSVATSEIANPMPRPALGEETIESSWAVTIPVVSAGRMSAMSASWRCRSAGSAMRPYNETIAIKAGNSAKNP